MRYNTARGRHRVLPGPRCVTTHFPNAGSKSSILAVQTATGGVAKDRDTRRQTALVDIEARVVMRRRNPSFFVAGTKEEEIARYAGRCC